MTAHSSFRGAAVVVQIDTPGGMLQHPLPVDDPAAVDELTGRLLDLLTPERRAAAVVTVHRTKEDQT